MSDTNATELTAADMLARTLAANGCKRAYGIPGGEVLAIIDAFDRAGIEFVLIKHENSGGFMAEGSWHADGFPPVLVATVGPGVANAVNVVAKVQLFLVRNMCKMLVYPLHIHPHESVGE